MNQIERVTGQNEQSWSIATDSYGRLIINADDWGRDRQTTERIYDCVRAGAVSSVSAMVFMEDSAHSAQLALEYGVDAGLHLNFTSPFTSSTASTTLAQHQGRIARFLRRSKWAPALFHPGLVGAFEYVVRAQIEEYRRLFGHPPDRIDGHHHMHLCANVVRARLLPSGVAVRRNFSFQPGDKSFVNRSYRQWQDRALARRHPLTHYFYSLPPLEPRSRVERIFALAKSAVVEAETHPVHPAEYQFLMSGEVRQLTSGIPIATRFVTPYSYTLKGVNPQ